MTDEASVLSEHELRYELRKTWFEIAPTPSGFSSDCKEGKIHVELWHKGQKIDAYVSCDELNDDPTHRKSKMLLLLNYSLEQLLALVENTPLAN